MSRIRCQHGNCLLSDVCFDSSRKPIFGSATGLAHSSGAALRLLSDLRLHPNALHSIPSRLLHVRVVVYVRHDEE